MQEDSALSRLAGQSMTELQDALTLHGDIQRRVTDPAAIEVIEADRLLAAVNNKAVSAIQSNGEVWDELMIFLSQVAMKNALKAVEDAAQLPAGPRAP